MDSRKTDRLVCSLSRRRCSRIFRYFSLLVGLIAPSCATAATSFGSAERTLSYIVPFNNELRAVAATHHAL